MELTQQQNYFTKSKVKTLIEAPAPTSVAEVRSFLGMANYSANFIQHYSETTAPLRHLTKKNARFQWTKECQKAFETLKQAMVSPQVMSYYDPTRPTELIVDASKYGLASMLTQLDPKTGKYKVVRYDSRSTTQPESRYAQIELSRVQQSNLRSEETTFISMVYQKSASSQTTSHYYRFTTATEQTCPQEYTGTSSIYKDIPST